MNTYQVPAVIVIIYRKVSMTARAEYWPSTAGARESLSAHHVNVIFSMLEQTTGSDIKEKYIRHDLTPKDARYSR